jgi:hypothetical protein
MTPDLVWWQIHGSTIKAFPKNDQRRIRKFIFQWLPTSGREHKYNNAVSDKCPSCKTCVETHHHLLHCYTISRATIKDNAYDQLDQFLSNEKHTPTSIRTIFVNRFKSECSTELPSAEHDLQDSIQQACDEQSKIGWEHLIQGRISIKWEDIIASHLDANKIWEKEMSALVWGRTLVKTMFQFVLELWNQRNTEAHTPNANKESTLSRQRILDQIEALQASQPQVRHCVRDFVYRDFKLIKKYSLNNLLSWYRMATCIIKKEKGKRLPLIDIRSCFHCITDSEQPIALPASISSDTSYTSESDDNMQSCTSKPSQ